MGWRFRQSFTVIPGLRLNLSKSGLSASVGGAPFTVNVGPHGVMGTASIPGTGISFRHHFDSDPPSPSPADPSLPSVTPPSSSVTPLPQHQQTRSAPAPIEEIRSASTELLTSDSLKELKKLIQMTYHEREDIRRQLDEATTAKLEAATRYESWESGFLLKRLFRKAFAERKDSYETETAKVSELEEQLQLTKVAAQIEIEKEQGELYFRMRDEFARLSESAAIWDVKSRQATDQYRERTTAVVRIDRHRVKFKLGSCDLIHWEQVVPCMENANGGDLYLYPGFILYRAAREAFSVIDYHYVQGHGVISKFEEQQGVPSDSKVVGETWAKVNKDGSRDRRFSNNYKIPIALYASLTLKSSTGLWEEFLFSNTDRLAAFLDAHNKFTASFASEQATAAASSSQP